MKHDAALRALMGESKAQQKQRLQERLEQLRKLKQEGGEVDEGQMAALEQVEAEGVDAVDAEVLNQLIEETMTNTEEVTTSTLLNDLSVRLTFSSPIRLRLPPPSLPPLTSRSHIFHPIYLCPFSFPSSYSFFPFLFSLGLISIFPFLRFRLLSSPPFRLSLFPLNPLSPLFYFLRFFSLFPRRNVPLFLLVSLIPLFLLSFPFFHRCLHSLTFLFPIPPLFTLPL